MRTRQNVRPLSREKEAALRVWIETALCNSIISEAPAIPKMISDYHNLEIEWQGLSIGCGLYSTQFLYGECW
jgi:hypothetical protein